MGKMGYDDLSKGAIEIYFGRKARTAINMNGEFKDNEKSSAQLRTQIYLLPRQYLQRC